VYLLEVATKQGKFFPTENMYSFSHQGCLTLNADNFKQKKVLFHILDDLPQYDTIFHLHEDKFWQQNQQFTKTMTTFYINKDNVSHRESV
jgi:hypothetical protein